MDSDDASDSRPGAISSLDRLPLHSTDLLTLLDESGVVLYESPSIERLYGYDQEELVGEQVAEYFHPEDRERVMEAFAAIVSRDGHHVETVEYRHLMADGSYRWIESVGSTNPTPDGNYVINSRDISERKQRERELQQTREQVQSERDGKEAIRQLLLGTTTDTEIATSVCRLLVEDYGYEAAWVAQSGSSDDDQSTVLVADHGRDRGFRTDGNAGTWGVDEVTQRVLMGDEPVTVTTETDSEEQFVTRLDAADLYSVRSVPLEHDGLSYGALTAVRTDPGSEFAGELIEEVAAALAFKHRVQRQREALVADTVTELRIRLTERHVLAGLSAVASLGGARLYAEEVRWTDDLVTYLVKTSGVDADMLESIVTDLNGVHETTQVSESDASTVVSICVDAVSLGSVVTGYGGTLESITACDGRVDVTVQLPRRTDVGAVVDAVQGHYPDATMDARNQRTVDEHPAGFGTLTDKQENALRAATLAGFFERPQGASADDVAETLGVTASTFLHHLRTAERKVFTDAFGHAE